MNASLAHPVATVPMPVGELMAVAREYVDAARFDAADRLLGHVLAADARHAEALHLSGFIAFRKNRFALAATKMEQALAAGAGTARQLCNLAEVYRVLGRIDDGLVAIRRALALVPSDPTGHFNEAMLRYERMQPQESIDAARRAILLKPDMAEAHMRLGQTLLLTGAFEEGFEEYEWRYGISGAQPLMPAEFVRRGVRPQWDGRALGPGERLLLIADQGFGDVLMFARYLPWAMARAADLTVAVSADLLPLLSRVFPGPAYTFRWDEIGEHAAQCSFSGLPRLAGTRLGTVPDAAAYVRADPVRAAIWRDWLDRHLPGGTRRVGIAWAGRPTHNNDRNRSVTLDVLAPLAALPGIALVSLQKGPASTQLAAHPAVAVPDLTDFEDTAGLLAHLDLVVSVDTSVVHLAGAMGRPAWVMLPFAPDWRWLRDRADSPWYGSLRLYRQPAPQAWNEVVRRIALDLVA